MNKYNIKGVQMIVINEHDKTIKIKQIIERRIPGTETDAKVEESQRVGSVSSVNIIISSRCEIFSFHYTIKESYFVLLN